MERCQSGSQARPVWASVLCFASAPVTDSFSSCEVRAAVGTRGNWQELLLPRNGRNLATWPHSFSAWEQASHGFTAKASCKWGGVSPGEDPLPATKARSRNDLAWPTAFFGALRRNARAQVLHSTGHAEAGCSLPLLLGSYGPTVGHIPEILSLGSAGEVPPSSPMQRCSPSWRLSLQRSSTASFLFLGFGLHLPAGRAAHNLGRPVGKDSSEALFVRLGLQVVSSMTKPTGHLGFECQKSKGAVALETKLAAALGNAALGR